MLRKERLFGLIKDPNLREPFNQFDYCIQVPPDLVHQFDDVGFQRVTLILFGFCIRLACIRSRLQEKLIIWNLYKMRFLAGR